MLHRESGEMKPQSRSEVLVAHVHLHLALINDVMEDHARLNPSCSSRHTWGA